MNLIIFGPPGIGKSTQIGSLKSAGYRAVDLEDFESRNRFQVPNWLRNAFIAGADLDPKRKYPGAIKVLLVTDENKYARRRAIRDASVPGKGEQPVHTIAQWIEGNNFDERIDASGGVRDTTDRLIELFKKYNRTEGGK